MKIDLIFQHWFLLLSSCIVLSNFLVSVLVSWFLVLGSWFLVLGSWFLVLVACILYLVSCILNLIINIPLINCYECNHLD
jgi:hypothetical protein